MMQCTKCGHEINCKVNLKTEEKGRPIEISYQWWYCDGCGAKYYGILEDSNVNIFDDRLMHKGYLVEESVWQQSLNWALKCPDPGNAHCTCEVHRDGPQASLYGESAWYTYE